MRKLANNKISLLILVCFLTMGVVSHYSCKQDKCQGTNCAHGGFCTDGVCSCPLGYAGPTCDSLSKLNFIGTWTVQETGTTSAFSSYTLYIYSDTPANQVIIYNLYNYFSNNNYLIRATIKGDTITMPNQQYAGKVVFGNGYIVPSVEHGRYGAIEMMYEVIDTSISNKVDDFGVYPLLDGSKASTWIKE